MTDDSLTAELIINIKSQAGVTVNSVWWFGIVMIANVIMFCIRPDIID